MIVANAGDPGNQLIILGIDAENVRRLQRGKPIRVTQESHPGFPLAGVSIMILYGETPAAIVETLKPAMSADTKFVNAANARQAAAGAAAGIPSKRWSVVGDRQGRPDDAVLAEPGPRDYN